MIESAGAQGNTDRQALLYGLAAVMFWSTVATAFKLALRHPERFGAAASLSGALDFATRAENPDPERVRDLELVVGQGSRVRGTENDLLFLAERLSDAGVRVPPLYQCCGTGDFLYEDNVRFRDHALNLGLPLTYEEHPGDEHEWGYWDLHIQKALEWMLK